MKGTGLISNLNADQLKQLRDLIKLYDLDENDAQDVTAAIMFLRRIQ